MAFSTHHTEEDAHWEALGVTDDLARQHRELGDDEDISHFYTVEIVGPDGSRTTFS